MTREEHLKWAKERALKYLDAGDLPNAFSSMGSDMGKHPELGMNAFLGTLGLLHVQAGDARELRRWIEGFN